MLNVKEIMKMYQPPLSVYQVQELWDPIFKKYWQVFEAHCPQAYSYAYDDNTSTFFCRNTNYDVIFCWKVFFIKSNHTIKEIWCRYPALGIIQSSQYLGDRGVFRENNEGGICTCTFFSSVLKCVHLQSIIKYQHRPSIECSNTGGPRQSKADLWTLDHHYHHHHNCVHYTTNEHTKHTHYTHYTMHQHHTNYLQSTLLTIILVYKVYN